MGIKRFYTELGAVASKHPAGDIRTYGPFPAQWKDNDGNNVSINEVTGANITGVTIQMKIFGSDNRDYHPHIKARIMGLSINAKLHTLPIRKVPRYMDATTGAWLELGESNELGLDDINAFKTRATDGDLYLRVWNVSDQVNSRNYRQRVAEVGVSFANKSFLFGPSGHRIYVYTDDSAKTRMTGTVSMNGVEVVPNKEY